MKFSQVKVAVTMLISVIATAMLGFIPICIALASALLAFIVFSLVKRRLDVGTAIILLSAIIAFLSYSLSVSNISHKSLNYIDRYVTMTGTVISVPEKSKNSDNYRYFLRINSIENTDGLSIANDTLLLTTPNKLSCGDGVRVKGIIKTIPKKMNGNNFDTPTYYKSRNIFTRVFSKKTEIDDSCARFTIYALGGKVAQAVDKLIYSHYSNNSAAILSAILTGNKHNFTVDYDYVLNKTNFKLIYHPAFIHIGLILTIIGFCHLFMKKSLQDIITVLVLVVYAVLQCNNIGFSRCLMCSALVVVSKRFWGRSFFPDNLALVVIICAILTPTIFFNSSFVVSSVSSMLIWAFGPYVNKKLRFIKKKPRRILSIMIISLFLMTPISSYYFGNFCVYSFAAPFVTVPIISFIILCTPIVFCMLELFGTAPIIGTIYNYTLLFLYKLPYFVRSLPFSQANIAKPTVTAITAFVFLIFTLYYYMKSIKPKAHIFCAFTVGMYLTICTTTILDSNKAEFSFVNVGQGDGTIIQMPFRETVIIDGGGGNGWSNFNPGEAYFLPSLQREGINHIEAAVVSHYHSDHIEGVIAAISEIKTDVVFAPAVTDCYSPEMAESAKELEEVAEANGTKVYYVSENTRVRFESGLTLDIYTPDHALATVDDNDTTIPVMVSYGDFSALFTGDMSANAERLLMNITDVDADILKVGHHGSRYSSCSEFVEAVSPEYSIISCGEGNSYGHPHIETLDRLSDTEILRTDQLGEIKIIAEKNGDFYLK